MTYHANPRVGYASCCILSYNRPDLLAYTLSTLRINAGAPLELIVHDDGSSRDTTRLLAQQVNEGMISTVILNPPGHNQGQGTALNRMFRIATGNPIIKIDQDLIFHPGWLATINAILDGNADRDRVKRALAHQRTPEPLIGLLGLMHYHHDPVASNKCIVAQHNGWQEHTHILGSAFAVRRTCWEALRAFEEHSANFGEDWDFQRRVTASKGDEKAHHDGHEKGIGPKGYVCGLPNEDLCTNVGMGYGPSTVNVEPGKVQPIWTRPFIINSADTEVSA